MAKIASMINQKGGQNHSQADDLRARFKVPEWGVFCHTERLRDHPARLNLVLSDSARYMDENGKDMWEKITGILAQLHP